MNIFYTNNDSYICSIEHCDIHTRKMIVEYAQMLSTSHHILDKNSDICLNNIYKKTHQNHPSTIWVRSSRDNYLYLFELWNNLLKNYSNYSNKNHKTSRLIKYLKNPPTNISNDDFFEPPKCMDKDIIDLNKNVIESYKIFINRKILDWSTRSDKRKMIPKWYSKVPYWVENNECFDELANKTLPPNIEEFEIQK